MAKFKHRFSSSVTGRPMRGTHRGGSTSKVTPPVSPDASSFMPRRTLSAGRAHFPSLSSLSRPLSSSASSVVGQRPRLSSPPRLQPSQPTKSFTRASSTSKSPSMPRSSSGKAALSSSEQLLPCRSSAMLTSDVVRPPYSTISSHSCSYGFPLTH